MTKRVLAFILAVLISAMFSLNTVFAEEPEVFGDAAILIDMDTGRILYEKNADKKVYPASTTKIMTGILVLENCGDRLGDIVTAGEIVNDIIGTGASHIGICVGEELTVEQLLCAVLIASANEACDVLAEYMCGSVDEFVALMNKKAEELGMNNTHFANAHGFHDANHYTTAKDMAIIARYAMKNEKFREIVKMPTYFIDKTNKYNYGDGTRNLSNTSDLIKQGTSAYYKYATGIKTGYTSEAGNCLVASATKESEKSSTKSEMNLIAATFNSQSENGYSGKYSDVTDMFEYGFNNYSIVSISVPDKEVGEVSLKYGKGFDSVTAVIGEEIKTLLPNDINMENDIKKNYTYKENLKAPIKKGDIVGSVEYIYTDTVTGESINLGTANLVAKNDIEKAFFKQVGSFFKKLIFNGFVLTLIIIFVLLIIIASALRRKRKKRRRSYLNSKRRKSYSRYRR